MRTCDVSELVGLTLDRVVGCTPKSDEVLFHASCGRTFRMWHEQDCCESVSLEDVAGNPEDLVGAPIVMAEEQSDGSKDAASGGDDTETWTFYKFATSKGYVTLRWYGSSNGYYAEGVSFAEATQTETGE